MEKEKRYGCPGCGGEVSQKQYEAGQTTCNDENCVKFGEPLEEMQYCDSCNEYYGSNKAEEHVNCS
jgi:hypothetical protein